MNLINATDNDCLAASLAMVLDESLDDIKQSIYPDPPEFPFPEPWGDLPRVPDMNVIATWMYAKRGIAITPFDHDPRCTPHERCCTVPVFGDYAEAMFEHQLGYGPGMIECEYKDKRHMVAWNGVMIYDPHGYTFNFAGMDKFGLTPIRFWLFSKVT